MDVFTILSVVAFLLGTAVIVYFSRAALLHPRSHGFYRFFAWEILLLMFLLNWRSWFSHPLAWYQLLSWALLLASLYLLIEGVRLLRGVGQPDSQRGDDSLLGLEKTSQLVESGAYRYIRHPLYSSLLCLGWGIFFKSPSWLDAILALACTLFLIATARVEEREDLAYFGEAYRQYMQRTRMFIPYVF